MAKEKKAEPTPAPEVENELVAIALEAEPTPAPEGFVAVRLKQDAPYGRVQVGAMTVERASLAYIPNEEFERLADEYGIELAE